MVRNLNIAMIGGGFMGKAHSMAWSLAPIGSSLGATLTRQVLVDVRDSEGLAAELGWNEHASDWREVVARDDIDIIDICTPPQFHAPIALAAIAAGKHVFCEKPVSNDLAESEQMALAAEAAGIVNQVGFNYRHTPAIQFAKQLLDEGRLGLPLQFRGSYLQEGGFAADPNRWRASKATGGSGTLGDIGSHIIDVAEFLFGDIVRVSARLRAKNQNREEGWTPEAERLSEDHVDEAGVWIAEFENGAIGSFSVNTFASGRKNRLWFEFDATKGAVEFDWNDREAFRVSYVDEERDHMGFRTIHTSEVHPNGWWRLAGLGTGYVEISSVQFQSFVRSILAGTRARPDFRDAAHRQRVVEAVASAAVSDSWVAVAD